MVKGTKIVNQNYGKTKNRKINKTPYIYILGEGVIRDDYKNTQWKVQ